MEMEKEAASEEGAAGSGDDGSIPESLPELVFSDDLTSSLSEESNGGTPSPQPPVRHLPRIPHIPVPTYTLPYFHRSGPQGSMCTAYGTVYIAIKLLL